MRTTGSVMSREADAFLALELVDEASFDVVDVFDAVAEVDVFLFEELLGVFAEGTGDGILGGEAVFFDALVEGVEEGGVVEEAEVEVEDGSGFLAEVAGGLIAEEPDIGAGGGKAVGEALAFGFDLGGGDGAVGRCAGLRRTGAAPDRRPRRRKRRCPF